jgi:hypothetical protein
LLLPIISTLSFRDTKTGDSPEAAAPPPTTHHTQGGQDDTNLQFPNSLHQRDQPKIHTKQNRFQKRERETHTHTHTYTYPYNR